MGRKKKEEMLEEMKEKINSKVADFALKIKNAEEDKKEVKYSINPIFTAMDTVKFSSKEVKTLTDIIENSHVKFSGK